MTQKQYTRDEFKNVRDYYVTKGVAELLQPELVILLLILIDTMEADERDYLQFFTLCNKNDYIEVIHEQEEPEYTNTIRFVSNGARFTEQKIFVIAEDNICTILLNSEY